MNTDLIWILLVRPTLDHINRQSPHAARILAVALNNVKNSDTGFFLDFVNVLFSKQQTEHLLSDVSLNVTECLLRAQSRLSNDHDLNRLTLANIDSRFVQLYERTALLKKLLSRIPDEINRRSNFLQTIKEIASAIKKIIDSLDYLIVQQPTPIITQKHPLEARKRLLVKDSKLFSQSLKSYFKGDLEAEFLFSAACQLIYDANVIDKVCFKSK